ncbi:MAG: endopeptidase La [Spirochaetaceae bacterium]|jgi:ATP-dependent Lon protease|nr:endopeptidase La [Spirochaetaceae bacterium]
MAEQSVVPIDQILPHKLPLVALMGRPIFPGIFTPIMIGNPPDVKVIDDAVSGDGLIGLVMLRNETENPLITDLYQIGTVAKIVKKINLPDGGVNIFISTLKRFRIKKALHPAFPIVAAVEYLDDEEDDTAEVKALTRALIAEMKQISENNPLFSEEMRLNMINIDHPGKIANFIASILNIDKGEQQKILEMLNVRKRMEQVLVFIKKEQELLRIQKRIQKEINEKIEKSQRDYFLREELKAIKSELGMTTDAKSSEYQHFKEKIDAFNFEGEVKEAVEQELEKFNLMEPNSAEFTVTRNYLDMIVNLPWNDPPPEDFDLKSAREILEMDHYGLKDVKDRIAEYLAVRKLRNQGGRAAKSGPKNNPGKAGGRVFDKYPTGSIICLLGPPGVGKTSVGRSIARALGKQFFRFSVGGMRDEAEIKGHRRTYIGAMPGKIIQGLKITKTKDPVFLIDEIDKMGVSYQGDPASALLEVLDPEQNFSFRDHYLDLPFDISRVFFIITANTLDTIPPPLMDRMEIIELPGYIDTEKLEIARRYLVPKSLAKNGLKRSQVKYTKDSLLHIANGYAREAGVRNFEKNLDKIHRKLAIQIVEAEEKAAQTAPAAEGTVKQSGQTVETQVTAGEKKAEPVPVFAIDKKNIEIHLGKPLFLEDVIKRADKPGMSLGLAWTSMGGDTLIIEAVASPGKGGLTLTGKMGDTMKESASIAMTVARKVGIETYGVDPEWFEKNQIHLHIPEGATPKDGPSAGITMATALLSLLLGKNIRGHLAMTGELSLTGQVLPIGGLKEKTIAARRNKVQDIIIPKQNRRDLDDIPDHVKKSITFHPVELFYEVLDIALPPD